MKVAVYAISKNESLFVNRWYESMKEADSIYVLDTGSTDDTVSRLESLGVNVTTKIIEPFRFDIARNESLKFVPIDYDICVCTDLDEIFNPGWRSELEKSWNENTTRLRYIYNWSIKNNKPVVSFMYSKIHSRNNYKWKYPVHEVLVSTIDEVIVDNKNIVLNHYPDSNKSRSSYLPLLELALKENPNDPRCYHYLGREYMYYKEWNKAIDILIKHLNLYNSNWKEEKNASYRFISRCYINLNRYDEAEMYLKKAILELPIRKESYIELAYLYYIQNRFYEVINNLIIAKSIKHNQLEYINESFTSDSTIDDLLSISYFNLGLFKEAIFYINKAIDKEPDNKRLKQNKEIFEKRC